VDFFTEKRIEPLYQNEIVILCDASVLIATIQTANEFLFTFIPQTPAYDFLS
jgi:hypothetical protein